AIARLVDDPVLRMQLSRGGRSLVTKDFDQGVMIRSLERAYTSVLPESRRAPDRRLAGTLLNGNASSAALQHRI
ncbi:MAG: hypothetical protein M3Q09_02125, partial [Gemmatimonadota bacterium]|nr:hypothetical protein [Gemmatimonadota bacterium]